MTNNWHPFVRFYLTTQLHILVHGPVEPAGDGGRDTATPVRGACGRCLNADVTVVTVRRGESQGARRTGGLSRHLSFVRHHQLRKRHPGSRWRAATARTRRPKEERARAVRSGGAGGGSSGRETCRLQRRRGGGGGEKRGAVRATVLVWMNKRVPQRRGVRSHRAKEQGWL